MTICIFAPKILPLLCIPLKHLNLIFTFGAKIQIHFSTFEFWRQKWSKIFMLKTVYFFLIQNSIRELNFKQCTLVEFYFANQIPFPLSIQSTYHLCSVKLQGQIGLFLKSQLSILKMKDKSEQSFCQPKIPLRIMAA